MKNLTEPRIITQCPARKEFKSAGSDHSPRFQKIF